MQLTRFFSPLLLLAVAMPISAAPTAGSLVARDPTTLDQLNSAKANLKSAKEALEAAFPHREHRHNKVGQQGDHQGGQQGEHHKHTGINGERHRNRQGDEGDKNKDKDHQEWKKNHGNGQQRPDLNDPAVKAKIDGLKQNLDAAKTAYITAENNYINDGSMDANARFTEVKEFQDKTNKRATKAGEEVTKLQNKINTLSDGPEKTKLNDMLTHITSERDSANNDKTNADSLRTNFCNNNSSIQNCMA
ncbi:MAG: hypothetical protein M1829_000797 [Trizodia sp. TS-e1964]|nr:MAG: hypothetical protein M1829_000797 [Trizodia sp. TS-e1964]